MTELIPYIAAVVTALSALATVIILPRVGSSRRKQLGAAYSYAMFAVHAAEEMFAEGNGDTKYRYAVDNVLKSFHVSEEEARLLVKAAVTGARMGGLKPPKPTPPSPLRAVPAA